jgi:hypothetical protein
MSCPSPKTAKDQRRLFRLTPTFYCSLILPYCRFFSNKSQDDFKHFRWRRHALSRSLFSPSFPLIAAAGIAVHTPISSIPGMFYLHGHFSFTVSSLDSKKK